MEPKLYIVRENIWKDEGGFDNPILNHLQLLSMEVVQVNLFARYSGKVANGVLNNSDNV